MQAKTPAGLATAMSPTTRPSCGGCSTTGRPGPRLKLAAALGKNRSFVTQITNPAYLVPIPAKHVAIIFEVCHLSGAERAAFLEAYGRAHPGRLRASHREARTRTITVTVPDLGDDKKNRALEQLVDRFRGAARALRRERRLTDRCGPQVNDNREGRL